MSEGYMPVIGDIAEIMIGVQYIGILLLIGVVVLLTMVLPLPFKRARAFVGLFCLLAAALVFVWLYAGSTMGLIA